jgi:hypothetical protein
LIIAALANKAAFLKDRQKDRQTTDLRLFLSMSSILDS